jgi:ABC-2 type transport system permease protein
MKTFFAALWAEILKARRSKMMLGAALVFMILPLAGGLFMLILKDPEQAKAMGIINAKAQILAMTADWPSYLGMIAMGAGALGQILFAFITAWVFGREFSDHTVKEWLALPTPRWAVVAAKFVTVTCWAFALGLLVYLVSIGVGLAVGIPGGSFELVWATFLNILITVPLNIMLMPFAAFFASRGRGYILPLAWSFLALGLADLVSVLGWGDWFPWGVPVLVSGMVKPNADHVGLHSYLMVLLACVAGLVATFIWWRRADQTR